MIFTVQRFIEDYFTRRGLSDSDGYAVRLANAFWQPELGSDSDSVERRLRRVRTSFFSANRGVKREEFQGELASNLRRKFRLIDNEFSAFRAEARPATPKLKAKKRSIEELLNSFKTAVQARAIDSFWTSRKIGQLRPRPEKIAQAMLAVFAKGVMGKKGLVLREFSSGIGFVDVGISFSGVLHLVELKILTGKLVGPSQLAQYMESEQRPFGWLLLMDARASSRKVDVPPVLRFPSGLVRVVLIELNPTPPHLAHVALKSRRGGDNLASISGKSF